MAAIVREGALGVVKRKGVEKRYFVLFDDRLDYYKDEEDCRNGVNPRGHLALDEVVSLEEVDNGCVLHMQQGQELSLQALPEINVDPWVTSLRALLSASKEAKEHVPICHGPLRVVRKGKASQRYFLLVDDRLDYYTSLADWSEGKPKRGNIMLCDINSIEQGDGGFSIDVAGFPHPLELLAETPEDEDMWLQSLQAQLQVSSKEDFSVDGVLPDAHEVPAELVQASVPRAEGSRGSFLSSALDQSRVSGGVEASRGSILNSTVDQLRGSAFLDLPDEDHGPPMAIDEGSLDVLKERGAVGRYFVLFPDHFDYFNDRQEYLACKRPRCRVSLQEVQDMEVTDNLVIILRLPDRTVRLGPRDKQDALRWGQAFSTALTSCSDGAWPGEVVWGSSFAITDRQEDCKDEIPTPTFPEAQEEDHPNGDDFESLILEKAPLCQGTFLVQLKRGAEVKMEYLILHADRLSFFGEQSDAELGASPHMEILLSEVTDVEVLDTGFDVSIGTNRCINLYCASGVNLDVWIEAFSRVLDGRIPSPGWSRAVESASFPRSPPLPSTSTVWPATPPAAPEESPLTNSMTARASPFSSPPLPSTSSTWPTKNPPQEECPNRQLSNVSPTAAGLGHNEVPSRPLPSKPLRPHPAATPPAASLVPAASQGTVSSTGNSTSRASSSRPRRSQPTTGIPKPAPSNNRRSSSVGRKPSSSLIVRSEPIIQQGALALVKSDTEEMHYFLLFRGRFEYYPDVASAARGANPEGRVEASEVVQVRVRDDGFSILLEHESLEIRIGMNMDLEVWVQAFRRALVPEDGSDGQMEVENSACSVEDREREKECEPQASVVVTDEQIEQWYLALRERPLLKGKLGFLRWFEGDLATKFCLLFRDRIDAWDAAAHAVYGEQPELRLMLADVHSIETLLTGFILNCGSHRTEVHVERNGDLQAWIKTLHRNLAEVAASSPLDDEVVAAPSTPKARTRSRSLQHGSNGGSAALVAAAQRRRSAASMR